MKRVIVTLIFVFILAFATLSAQTTMYLKLPDIDGESQQQDHEVGTNANLVFHDYSV